MVCDAIELSVQVLGEYERSSGEYAWTEGLQWYEGSLYESTGAVSGRLGQADGQGSIVPSGLYQLSLENGQATVKVCLHLQNGFGEGLARVGNNLYQLTERGSTVLEYTLPLTSQSTPTPLQKAVPEPSDRWGLCFNSDNNQFYVSNGGPAHQLWIYDQFADIFNDKQATTITVTCDGKPLPKGYKLNDLEFASPYIYAAVITGGTGSSLILQIDPKSGEVKAQINASCLRKNLNPDALDLNGIAYNNTSDTFFITGKKWSKIFEVEFFPK